MDNNFFEMKNPSLTRGILVMILGVLVFTMGLGALGTLLGLLFLGYGVYEAVVFSIKNKDVAVGRATWKKTDEIQPEATEGCGLKRYHRVDNIMGLVVGVVACAVYIMTAEATASWWDCGEYIATANKLQVGHPPGAPSFQLFGRLFSMFSAPEDVAHAVNVMSAVCSGLTIMFLFWGITMLGKHLLPDPKNVDVKDPKTWAVFAAGLVGAFAYCFSDSFWFSAVEGEVYAMSSFFTALVFWAILKWEEQSDDPRSLRWIVLISLLVGVAIGVHLLNLLTVPAIFYVVYFKKWPKVTWKGFLLTGVISFITLALILWVIIPGIVNLDSSFDVFFVNSLGLPFNSGTIVYFALIAVLVVCGLLWSHKKKRPMLNAAIMSFAMLVIGYSTFFVLVIRANTNTPLNENCPKDAVSMRAYLGREQYGSTPLLTGQYYTYERKKLENDFVAMMARSGYSVSPIDEDDMFDSDTIYTKYVRDTTEGRDSYKVAAYATEQVFPKSHTGFLPRMWSADSSRLHQLFYEYWAGEVEGFDKPSFSQNIDFLNRYQFGWMYWRYFMWNFAGRQNDQQGHYFNVDGSRDYLRGNWISGINAIDEARLGPLSDQPDFMANDRSRNVYYLLPLLLGLLGLIYHIKKHPNDAFIVLLMFLMTGMAIAFYLNMPPRQPRERDYAFVGSFSFFAIWIGLGVMGLAEWISDLFKGKKEKVYKVVMPVVFVLCMLGVPVLMACQNWDDHDRSEKTAARDFAENYLKSIRKNGIIITHGDNDTFPLWYVQEVEGTRTDVRILNYTLSGMHWYVEQLYNKLYESDPLPFTLTKDFYGLGKDVYFFDDDNVAGMADSEMEVTDALKYMMSHLKQLTYDDASYGYKDAVHLPTRHLKLTLDVQKLVRLGVIDAAKAKEVTPVIKWTVSGGALYRNELMLLDIIGTNRFERDINMSNPDSFNKIFPARQYSIYDCMNVKLVPYKWNGEYVCDSCGRMVPEGYGPRCPYGDCGALHNRLFTQQSADFFLHGVDGKPLRWGNLNRDIYIDPVSREQFVPQLYNTLIMLANEECEWGNVSVARELMDMFEENFPSKNFLPNPRVALGAIELYKKMYVDNPSQNGSKKYNELWDRTFAYFSEEALYFTKFEDEKLEGVARDLYDDIDILRKLEDLAYDEKTKGEVKKVLEDINKTVSDESLQEMMQKSMQTYMVVKERTGVLFQSLRGRAADYMMR